MANAIITEQDLSKETEEPISSPRVLRLKHLIVNSYLVGERGAGSWAVVDAGLAPFCAAKIINAAETRFGRGVKPAAIVLTHGHFDHVGAIRQLVEDRRVPVYAHALELPYLTGQSSYPPPDPTVGGGLMARMSALYPRGPIDLRDHVQALPTDGVVPGMPGWRWIHTPGHSPGHISLFRFSDRLLIAGDAFVTVKQESLLAVLTERQEISRPPAYFTPNWAAAQRSLQALLALEPEAAATGHGIPMAGEAMRAQLRALVLNFAHRAVPAHGRYVGHPAVADESGTVSVPPAVADPFPRAVAIGLALAAVTGLGMAILSTRPEPARRPGQKRRKLVKAPKNRAGKA